DNRTRNGQAGVEILQLFHDQPGDRPLIINRGWLAWPDRRHLPAVPVAEGELQLQAEVLPPPGEGFRLQGGSTSGWPKLITHADPGVLATQAVLPDLPLMARLQPGSPGALRLDWPAMPMTATKHTGYAVQWFTLAAALLILFIWAGLRPAHPESNQHDEHDCKPPEQTPRPAQAAGNHRHCRRSDIHRLADGEIADRHSPDPEQPVLHCRASAGRDGLAPAVGANRLWRPLAAAGHRSGGLRRRLPEAGARGASDPRGNRPGGGPGGARAGAGRTTHPGADRAHVTGRSEAETGPSASA